MPKKKAGYKKHPGGHKAGTGLAQGSAQIVVFTLVVNHMGRPKQLPLMADAVVPVVEKIVQQNAQQPMADGCHLK